MHTADTISSIEGFKNKLFRFALRIVGDVVDAEDVIQDLTVKIWKKEQDYLQVENKEAWCMTVVRNLCIDKIRKRKGHTTEISEHYDLSDRSPNPEQHVEQQESLSIVMNILNTLPPQQKEIIHLRDVEGYSYKEIGEIIGVSEDQVKVNLYRARQRFKDKLIQHNIKR